MEKQKLIYVESKALFSPSEVSDKAIVFIKDTKEIWTHGVYFSCSGTWATPITLSLTGDTTGSVSIDGSGNASIATTTKYLSGTLGIDDVNNAANTQLRKIAYYRVNSNASNLFPVGNNANAILSLNVHDYSYTHLLGFSSDGNIYHRRRTAGTWETSWKTILNSSNYTNFPHTFASLTNKPTTLSGYGITDCIPIINGGNVTTDTDLSTLGMTTTGAKLSVSRTNNANVPSWGYGCSNYLMFRSTYDTYSGIATDHSSGMVTFIGGMDSETIINNVPRWWFRIKGLSETTYNLNSILDSISNLDSNYLRKSGGTITGNIILTTGKWIADSTTSTSILGTFASGNSTEGLYSEAGVLVGKTATLTTLSSNGDNLWHYRNSDKKRYKILDAANYTNYTIGYVNSDINSYGSVGVIADGKLHYNNALSFARFSPSDNSGRTSYELIAELPNYGTGTNTSYINYGISGFMWAYRLGNGNNSCSYSITAIVNVGPVILRNMLRVSATTDVLIPFVVKYNDKYYIALRKKNASTNFYFMGVKHNLLTTTIIVNDASLIEEIEGPITETSTASKFYNNGNPQKYLHAGNYNKYSPTLTGTGASGTWAINISGVAASASKVANALTIQLNGGTTAGTNKFVYDGSSAYTINITPAAIGASATNHTHDYLPLYGGILGSTSATETELNILSSTSRLRLLAYSGTNYIQSSNAGFTGSANLNIAGYYSNTGSNLYFNFANIYCRGNNYTNIDSGNYSSYALPLSGGTLTGTLISRDIRPSANLSYSLGASSYYYNYVYANYFKKNGSSDSYVLLGGGGHKAVSDFAPNNVATLSSSGMGNSDLWTLVFEKSYPNYWYSPTTMFYIRSVSAGCGILCFYNYWNSETQLNDYEREVWFFGAGKSETGTTFGGANRDINDYLRIYIDKVNFKYCIYYNRCNDLSLQILELLFFTVPESGEYISTGTLRSSFFTNSTTVVDLPIESSTLVRVPIKTTYNHDRTIKTSKSIYASSFYENSDIRLKENVRGIDLSDLTKLVDLVQFNFKDSDTKKYGVIALLLEQVGLQNLVYENDGKKAVDYISLLVLEIQRLRNEIGELKLEINKKS